MTEVKEDSTTATSNSESNAIAGVAERLYFFFSDANLRQDKFLRIELEKTPYVSLETLLKFNSIKNFTSDTSILIKAAKEDEKCKTKLKLNDDETGIGRITPFTKDLIGKEVELTVRVSNLPTSGDVSTNAVYDVTIDEVKDLFVEYGEVSMVRLLHNYIKPKGKIAYGRAFVEFESLEGMNKAVADLCVKDIANEEEKPKKSLKIKDTDLRVKTMQQWLDKKAKQKESYKSKGKNGQSKKNDKKETDKKREREEKEEEPVDGPEFKLDWKSGCIIKLTKLPEGCDREQILKAVYEVFDKDVGVRADYSRGQEDGCVRFDEVSPKIGELCTKLGDGSITIGETAVGSAAILEGEPEKEYYKNFIAFMSKNMRMRAEEKRNKNKRQKRY